MDVPAVLARLDYAGPTTPTLGTLRALQRAFLFRVPFENLDIHLGRRILLDSAWIEDKIVARRRGGFCYECNDLFARLLDALGYQVVRVSARMTINGPPTPEFSHMALLVALDEGDHLVDVGNGQSARDPLALEGGDAALTPEGIRYRVEPGENGYALLFQDEGARDWQPRFLFTTEPRQLHEFSGMCEFQQTSPKSVFRKQRLVTLATPDGRLTLASSRLTERRGGDRTERDLSSESEVTACLRDRFGLDTTSV